jgi:hypothetical protein
MSTNNLRDQLNNMGINGHYYNNVPNLQTPTGFVPNPFYDIRLPAGNVYIGPPQAQQITYAEFSASYRAMNR